MNSREMKMALCLVRDCCEERMCDTCEVRGTCYKNLYNITGSLAELMQDYIKELKENVKS